MEWGFIHLDRKWKTNITLIKLVMLPLKQGIPSLSLPLSEKGTKGVAVPGVAVPGVVPGVAVPDIGVLGVVDQ